MMAAGIALLTAAVAVTGTSAYLEWKFREPVYALYMKVGAILLAIGGVVFGCSL